MNIKEETIGTLKELGYDIWAHDDSCNGVSFDKANYIYVNYRSIKTPRQKEVTVEWILSKVNKETNYQNLSRYLRNVFASSCSVYPASYGIGVSSLLNREDDIKAVAEKLKSLGLKFRNELSDAGWVYRFLISKDAANMRIMESL